mmetsp:Transcript_127520/g.330569  ORF Transcript_127520/g.330569 Transcript_127520/m.330569 type:complete len:236 (+) Transcript_127520:3052-3759(+)
MRAVFADPDRLPLPHARPPVRDCLRRRHPGGRRTVRRRQSAGRRWLLCLVPARGPVCKGPIRARVRPPPSWYQSTSADRRHSRAGPQRGAVGERHPWLSHGRRGARFVVGRGALQHMVVPPGLRCEGREAVVAVSRQSLLGVRGRRSLLRLRCPVQHTAMPRRLRPDPGCGASLLSGAGLQRDKRRRSRHVLRGGGAHAGVHHQRRRNEHHDLRRGRGPAGSLLEPHIGAGASRQ